MARTTNSIAQDTLDDAAYRWSVSESGYLWVQIGDVTSASSSGQRFGLELYGVRERSNFA